MENMINRILDMEKKAHGIVEAAREKQSHLDQDIERDVQALKQNWTDKMNQKLETLRAQESEMMQKRLTQIETDTKMQLEKMELLQRENGKKWVDTLFESIFPIE